MNKKNNLGIVVAASALSMLMGCKETEAVQTVDWYKTHEKERKAVLEKCINNPSKLANTPNCLHAQEAAMSIKLKESKGLKIKPMIWDPKKGLVSQN